MRLWMFCAALTSAAGGAVAAPVYPIAVDLRVSPDARVAGLGRTSILDALRPELESAALRMFHPAPGTTDGILIEVVSTNGDLEAMMSGSRARVRSAIAIREPSGAEIAHLDAVGTADVLGEGEESIAAALGSAAGAAARNFEHLFADSPAVQSWLAGHGVRTMSSFASWPQRGRYIGFFDLAGIAVGRTDGLGPGALARAGASSKALVVQLVAAAWGSPWDLGDISVTDAGIEAGLVSRPASEWELRGGAGLHSLWAKLHERSPVMGVPVATLSFQRYAPTAFAAVQYSYWPHWGGGGRVRMGIEARAWFDATQTVPELRRNISVVSGALAVFIGIESPLGSAPWRDPARSDVARMQVATKNHLKGKASSCLSPATAWAAAPPTCR